MINRRAGMSIAVCILAPAYMFDISKYTKPIFKKRQSWQSINKVNLSKKQRRK